MSFVKTGHVFVSILYTYYSILFKKVGQVTHVAPLNRLPLLSFLPGGVSRSWSHKARPAANIVIYPLPQNLL
jgi:hypothetical protein